MSYESLKQALTRQESGEPPPATAGFFGADPEPAESQILLIPVPWEGTVSYGTGTKLGPDAIRSASHQLDLEDSFFEKPYRAGISHLPFEMLDGLAELRRSNQSANEVGAKINETLQSLCSDWIQKGKTIGVIGGEHSVPQGLIGALAATQEFGILHIDAHHDLRQAYEGYQFSHASIMYNALQTYSNVSTLVSVGIRDYSAEEATYARERKVETFYWGSLSRLLQEGKSWSSVSSQILSKLPQKVYVSFDIDGLSPQNCPNTGTPVPGGLSFDQAVYLLEELAASGKEIIGFDLCEVAPGPDGDEWDANVGARILYKLCGATLASQKKCEIISGSL